MTKRSAQLIAFEFVPVFLFPASLCGVLVFGCVLPPASSSSSRRLTHTQLSHTQNLHTHTQLTYTPLTQSLRVAGVALGDIDLHFAWQVCHLATSTVTSRGMRGTYGTGLALVALGSHLMLWSPRPFAWQAWRLATSTFLSRGTRGTWGHQSSFCVAGVALMGLGWLFVTHHLEHTSLSHTRIIVTHHL